MSIEEVPQSLTQVSSLLDHNPVIWDVGKIQQVFPPSVAAGIVKITLPSTPAPNRLIMVNTVSGVVIGFSNI